MTDLPKDLKPEQLDSLTSIALKAVCHAYGSQPLAQNTPFSSLLAIARSAADDQSAPPWREVKKRFVMRLRGQVAVQVLQQHQVHVRIAAEQQRMAAEAARMAAAVAAVEAGDGSDDADDDDDPPSYQHLSAEVKIRFAAIIAAEQAQRAAQLLATVIRPSAVQQVEAFLTDLKAGRNGRFDGAAWG